MLPGRPEPWPKVSVVIPTLNEARNLPHVFAELPAGLHEVIIVDGNSVDDTVATARRLRPDVRIVRQNRSGKGNALACGFAAATGDIIAMVDADGSADPAEIPQFVKALLDGADFAKGTRFADGGGSCDITRLRRLGNRILSGLVNVLCRTKYSDLCYGYNAFWRRHVPVFGLYAESDVPAGSGTRLWGDGFEVETLINIRIAQAGLKVKEVASYEHSRIHGVSNLNATRDGWRVLRTIFAERYYHHQRQKAQRKLASVAVLDDTRWAAGSLARSGWGRTARRLHHQPRSALVDAERCRRTGGRASRMWRPVSGSRGRRQLAVAVCRLAGFLASRPGPLSLSVRVAKVLAAPRLAGTCAGQAVIEGSTADSCQLPCLAATARSSRTPRSAPIAPVDQVAASAGRPAGRP